MKGQSIENVHYWTGTKHKVIDLQFVEWDKITNHPLKYFDNWDQAINWLFLNGFKDTAREINQILTSGRAFT